MKTIASKIVSSVTLLSLLAAGCGRKTSSDKASSPAAQGENTPATPATTATPATSTEETASPAVAVDGSNINGYYLATFITMNPHVNGTLPGSATFYRKEDRLHAYLRLFAGSPKAWHQQKVYTGTRCPSMADDTNADGYIDIIEAEAVVGKVLIPLDADLTTQNSGRNFYPVGDPSGSYHYERVVSFNRFLQDLKSDDKNLEDNVVKLAADEPLILEGKIIMIQGTAETVEYPETVASSNRHLPFQTLPIACGIFKKADIAPGSPDDEVIPGPVADVIEGQDRPAPDEEGTTTEVGGNTNGNTNEAERNTETRDEHGNRTSTGNGTTGRSETSENDDTPENDSGHTDSSPPSTPNDGTEEEPETDSETSDPLP